MVLEWFCFSVLEKTTRFMCEDLSEQPCNGNTDPDGSYDSLATDFGQAHHVRPRSGAVTVTVLRGYRKVVADVFSANRILNAITHEYEHKKGSVYEFRLHFT